MGSLIQCFSAFNIRELKLRNSQQRKSCYIFFFVCCFLPRGCFLNLYTWVACLIWFEGKGMEGFGDEFVCLESEILELWSNTLLENEQIWLPNACWNFLQHLCDVPSMLGFVGMLNLCVTMLRSWSCIFPFSLSQVLPVLSWVANFIIPSPSHDYV